MLLVRKTCLLGIKIPDKYFNPGHSFLRKFHRCTCLLRKTKLSPQEITEMLQTNEFSYEFNDPSNCVKSYDCNQLPANFPIEDTRSEAKCLLTRGILIGVFDGHCGPACAQVVAKRLFEYICIGLLPNDLLREYFASVQGPEPLALIERFNEDNEILTELKDLYRKSLMKYTENVISNRKENFCMEEALERAFLCLDEDISSEALNSDKSETNLQTISVAKSGAVACVAHIDGSDLHIAYVGDCRAVLGVLSEDNFWRAKELTRDHNYENDHERARITQEHPSNEEGTVISHERLLGSLAPFRAFGDVSYKWSVESLKKFELPVHDNYQTPPYLTAKPEITHHKLTSRDKFLIIASDGLWDELSPLQVVRLVGEHMRGKVVLKQFEIREKDMKLKDIRNLLRQRKDYFNVKPVDINAATHLIRNALSGCGESLKSLSAQLALPKNLARFYRDDMTATVVYFDSKYWRQVHH